MSPNASYRMANGVIVRLWLRSDGRHAYQVLHPSGTGESGSGATRAEAELLALAAVKERSKGVRP